MFSEKKCNTEAEHRSAGYRRVRACRRHNIRFDEYGYDRRVGLGRRSSDDRRAGSDRRSSDKGLEATGVNEKKGFTDESILKSYSYN
jgi:hypothetical protein